MALSALHIAKLRPSEEKQYLLLATRHHTVALPLIRSALGSITKDNCHALYACGHMLTKYAFASPQSPESHVFSPGIGAVSEFLPLLRGAFSVHDKYFGWLAAGPFAASLERPFNGPLDFTQNPEDESLARILQVLCAGSTEDADACCEALNLLRKLLAMVATPNQTISTKTLVYCWPAQVSQRYVTLMSNKNPKALVVLAHYCILLKMIDSFWFMKGCATRLLDQCRKDLDEEWHSHIEWPLSVVGLT